MSSIGLLHTLGVLISGQRLTKEVLKGNTNVLVKALVLD